MSIRHCLIRWLSCGDFILMNAELRSDGMLRTKEAGDHFIHNVRVDHRQDIAVSFGAQPARSAMAIQTTEKQRLLLSDVSLFGAKPRPEVRS